MTHLHVEEMRASLQAVTIFLLVGIAMWHLFCSLFFIYVALYSQIPWALLLLSAVLFLPFVLIRKIWRKRWMSSDVVLVALAVAPGLVFAIQEAARPYSPNVGWLVPVISAYCMAVIGVICLRFSNENPDC